MKFFVLLGTICITVEQTVFAQDCEAIAAGKPSVMTRGIDAVTTGTGKMNAAEMAKMKVNLAKAESWTKKLLTNFTGAKLLYYNSFFPKYLPDSIDTDGMFRAAGIKGHYTSNMMFFAYYCYDNSNKIHTEVESGSTIYVQFNNVFAFGFSSETSVYHVNGRKAFKIISKKRTDGKMDFYELRTQDNATSKIFTANEYIILRNSDKPVFIPVTRKDYLQQMLIDVEAFGKKNAEMMNNIYIQNARQFEEEMRIYKTKDKTYTAEKEAKRRKWFEEDQTKLKNRISKSSPETDAAREVIAQYLKKPEEWLNRGVRDFYSFSGYTAAGVTQYLESLDIQRTNEEEADTEVVTINPGYFNKTLSSDVPQVIMVHLRNGTYAHMEKVAAMVKQPGALAPLEAMLK